jgi:c-di-GMP-binding flagellar brake protein YcgR
MAEPASVMVSPGASTHKQSRSIYTTYLKDPEEICRVLKELRDERTELQLGFDSDPTLYTARILDIVDNDLLIEDVQPRQGLKLFREDQTFTFSGRIHGQYVHSSDNRIKKIDSERGVPYFHVGLPQQMLYQQRRKTGRYNLPLRVATQGGSVRMFRHWDDDKALIGRIIDISAGGCRVVFKGPVKPLLSVGEEIDTCTINIPNLLELSSKAAIRHFNYDKKSRDLTCGIELTVMHVTDRRRLEQLIQTIARADRTGKRQMKTNSLPTVIQAG